MQRNCSLWAKKSFWSFYTRTWIRAFIAQRKLHSAASNPFICTEVSFGSDSPGPLCLWTLLITVKSRPFVCDRVVIGPRPGLLQRRRGLKKKTANKKQGVFSLSRRARTLPCFLPLRVKRRSPGATRRRTMMCKHAESVLACQNKMILQLRRKA